MAGIESKMLNSIKGTNKQVCLILGLSLLTLLMGTNPNRVNRATMASKAILGNTHEKHERDKAYE
jgi:hypothetical protein